jgi:hypothetical protein
MAIRIKSERIHAMAKELAALTGQTQVAAVKQALEESLAAIDASKRANVEGRSERLVRKTDERMP